MPGRSPREAVKAYRELLQKNVSIICTGVLTVSNYDKLDQVSVLTLPDPVPLNGRSDLYLSFTQQYKIIEDTQNGPYRVSTRYYKYAIEHQNGSEIFGYHWHPEGPSPITFPHLHIGPAAKIGMAELVGRAHFPTGRVAFEDVVEFLILNFGVKPDRTLWQELVEKTRTLFTKHKTW